MGIEKFMNQFNNLFNMAHYIDYKTNNLQKIDDVDEIIFDFNSIIHNCIHEMTNELKNNPNIEDDVMIQIVSNNFINHIYNTIKTENCKISIFMDGVPSLNKMNEQKHRKFYSRLISKLNSNNKNEISWDRNKISPGTEFMINLTEYLKSQEFSNKLNKKMNNVKIVFISDTFDIDEAEIKIVRYIKKIYKKNKKYIIYSPDADVLLLCMSFNKKNINTIRIEYDNHDGYKYRYVNIDKFMYIMYKYIKIYKYFILNIDNENVIEKIKVKYNKYYNNIIELICLSMKNNEYIKSLNIKKIDTKNILENKYDVINDLILLFIFFGNDFMPKICSITLNEIEINLFLFHYCSGVIKYVMKNDNNNQYFSKKIDLDILLSILKDISNIELNYINNSLPQKTNGVINSGIRYIKPDFNHNKYLFKTINPLKIVLNNQKNNNQYKYFDIDNIPENIKYNINEYTKYIEYMSKKHGYNNVNNTCINYLNGIYWIKDSYFNGIINKWIYGNIFSPLLINLYEGLKNNINIIGKNIYNDKIIDNNLLTPELQFIITCPYDRNDDNIKMINAFTSDTKYIKIILNKIKNMDKIVNKKFYISSIDLSKKLNEYIVKNKLNNENNINNYQMKYKNSNFINYMNLYDSYNIDEIVCFNQKYLEKCHITYNTFDFINNDIILLINK